MTPENGWYTTHRQIPERYRRRAAKVGIFVLQSHDLLSIAYLNAAAAKLADFIAMVTPEENTGSRTPRHCPTAHSLCHTSFLHWQITDNRIDFIIEHGVLQHAVKLGSSFMMSFKTSSLLSRP